MRVLVPELLLFQERWVGIQAVLSAVYPGKVQESSQAVYCESIILMEKGDLGV